MMRAVFFLLSFAISTLFAKTVYIVPIIGYEEKKMFFDPYSYRDQIAKPFCALREEIEKMGFEVKFTHDCIGLEDVSAIISFEAHPDLLSNMIQYPSEKCFLICFDPPVSTAWVYERKIVECFKKIYVMLDDFVDNTKYYKFHFPQPHFERVKDIPPFSEKKLLCMISGNFGHHNASHPKALYKERQKVVVFYENLRRHFQIEDFDLWGRGWDFWQHWKGTVTDKLEAYKRYKFAYCYENMRDQNGYVSEKIFDCFLGGCVPIYLGADNITDYVPKECFIDRRDFSSEGELYLFLKNIDEATYMSYLQAAKNYLESDKMQLFSIDCFVNLIKQDLSQL